MGDEVERAKESNGKSKKTKGLFSLRSTCYSLPFHFRFSDVFERLWVRARITGCNNSYKMIDSIIIDQAGS